MVNAIKKSVHKEDYTDKKMFAKYSARVADMIKQLTERVNNGDFVYREEVLVQEFRYIEYFAKDFKIPFNQNLQDFNNLNVEAQNRHVELSSEDEIYSYYEEEPIISSDESD